MVDTCVTLGQPRSVRKERVLHARIPADLERELKKRSASLGVSVSTVVRNILQHTFDLVEGIVVDSSAVARILGGGAARANEAPKSTSSSRKSDTVLGWQELTLNLNAVCDVCNRVIERGDRAAVAVPVSERPQFRCPDCLAVPSVPRRKTSSAKPTARVKTPKGRGRPVRSPKGRG